MSGRAGSISDDDGETDYAEQMRERSDILLPQAPVVEETLADVIPFHAVTSGSDDASANGDETPGDDAT